MSLLRRRPYQFQAQTHVLIFGMQMRPPTQMFAIVCLNYTFFRLNFKMESLFGATVVSAAWGLLDI